MDVLSQYYRTKLHSLVLSSGLNISSTSNVNASIFSHSLFKNDTEIVLPFVIEGRLVTAKAYPEKNYQRVVLKDSVLKESLNSWVGIKIYKSHEVYRKILLGEPTNVDDVVGKVISVSWNDQDKAIDFVAEIYDRGIAYKMDMGLINAVSVGFGRSIIYDRNDYYYTDIKPREISLVFDPRDSDAVFVPKK